LVEFWRLTPLQIMARLEHLHMQRKWLSFRIAAVICASATRKDGSPLQPRDVGFPELNDD